MLNQKLSHKMLQRLSPQQIQLMKLLQIPTATLDQRIKEELEANPALDEGEENEETNEDIESYASADSDTEGEEKDELANKEEEFELDDYIEEYLEEDPSSYKLQANNYSQDEEEKTITVAVEDTFHEYLEAQVGLMDFANDKEEKIAHQIVGSIDDDGYLRRDPIAIIDDLMFAHNTIATPDEVVAMLVRIQKFDPPGVGARDLRECLLIQIQHKVKAFTKKGDHPPQAFYDALEILEHHFNEFSKKHFQKLQRHIGSSEEELREAYDEILKLNPKPASGHVGQNNKGIHYIVPDFIIENRDGELDLTLNSRNAPDLRINDQYTDMLKSYKESTKDRKGTKTEKEAVMFIKQKIDSAKWFIDAIKQRQQTMYKSMYAIMQYQYDFFLSGDQKKLRPMILKDIADITGLDISTVSRVANSKFVQTEFGTKRLKDFFSESLQTSTGEEVSTLEVKKILTEIISQENKRKPLSDEKLKNLLQDKNYNIARRTVAKYREQLNIPVARLRKVL